MPRIQIEVYNKPVEIITDEGVNSKTGNKITVVNKQINTREKYSAIKTLANQPEPYSKLNPDTNSDSASLKSKGVRLDSAREAIIQHIERGKDRKMMGA